MRISDLSSDVCSSDLFADVVPDDPVGPVFDAGCAESWLEVSGGEGACDEFGVGCRVPLQVVFVADPGVPWVEVGHAEQVFRPEDCRVGQECVRTFSSGWSLHT